MPAQALHDPVDPVARQPEHRVHAPVRQALDQRLRCDPAHDGPPSLSSVVLLRRPGQRHSHRPPPISTNMWPENRNGATNGRLGVEEREEQGSMPAKPMSKGMLPGGQRLLIGWWCWCYLVWALLTWTLTLEQALFRALHSGRRRGGVRPLGEVAGRWRCCGRARWLAEPGCWSPPPAGLPGQRTAVPRIRNRACRWPAAW